MIIFCSKYKILQLINLSEAELYNFQLYEAFRFVRMHKTFLTLLDTCRFSELDKHTNNNQYSVQT